MPPVGFEPKISAGERPAAAHLLRSEEQFGLFGVSNVKGRKIFNTGEDKYVAIRMDVSRCHNNRRELTIVWDVMPCSLVDVY